MKKLLLTLTSVLFCAITLAQSVPQGINYQAVARDANGDVLMNQTLTIQFSVISDIATSAISWQETQQDTTNDYGLFTAIIGQGTTTSVGSSLTFDVIDWGASHHFLKVEIDYGGGLVDMGTTAFMSVPYALKSGNSVFEFNTNGSGIQAPTDTASGPASTAMGYYTEASGNNSTAMGYNTDATGNFSTAMGLATDATGNASTAMGYQTEATESYSTAMGYYTEASGNSSTAMGRNTEALAYSSTAIGAYNLGGGDGINWVGTDPLFEVGNGSYNNRNNAFTIYKNGRADFDNSVTATHFIGDGSGLTNLPSGGGIFTFNTNGIGIQAPTDTASGYGSTAMGRNTEASGSYSTAMGYYTEASGNNSTAMGINTTASGYYSTAMGSGTEASGNYSTAMGRNTEASGTYSTAMGYDTDATGILSTAMGYDTDASGDYSTAMGRYAEASGYSSIAMGYDTKASGDYSTAMGYYTEASGDYSTAMGHDTEASGDYSTAMGLYAIAFGVGELSNSGNVRGLSFISMSDRRVKQNISPFSGALSKVMLLNPKTYFYNTVEFPRFEAEKDKPQIGFIAQEVEAIFPEMVTTDGDEVGLKGVRYGQLTAVLVQAIKEMKEDYQSQIDDLQKEIIQLKNK